MSNNFWIATGAISLVLGITGGLAAHFDLPYANLVAAVGFFGATISGIVAR